jgi:hypothetical protein
MVLDSIFLEVVEVLSVALGRGFFEILFLGLFTASSSSTFEVLFELLLSSIITHIEYFPFVFKRDYLS